MKKRITVSSCIAIALACVMLTFQITYTTLVNKYSGILKSFTEQSQSYVKLSTIENIVKKYFIGDIDEKYLTDMLISGYVAGLNDKYSTYLNEEELASFVARTEGKSEGFGMEIYQKKSGEIIVSRVVKGSPADTAGLIPGDVLYKISDKILDNDYDGALSAITDSATCTLTVLRDGIEHSFVITRAEFEVETVSYEKYGDIGYVRIFAFNDLTENKFKEAVNTLVDGGASGLIFDVRDNLGGSLDSVVSVLDFLIAEGTIVRLYTKDGEVETKTRDSSCIDVPMAVIMNSNTASAAELFASALSDHDKAVLVGERSYGKGTVISVFRLTDSTGLVLSTKMFLPPVSDGFEGVGIEPDVEVTLNAEIDLPFHMLEFENDTQLQSAIDQLTQGENS